jgi:predicted AAA+ superfamily ATPase
MECIKNNLNLAQDLQFYYWRDNHKLEVDLIIQKNEQLLAVEIKSAQTYSKDFSNSIKRLMGFSDIKKGLVIYDGDMEFSGSDGIELLNWKSFLMRNLFQENN